LGLVFGLGKRVPAPQEESINGTRFEDHIITEIESSYSRKEIISSSLDGE